MSDSQESDVNRLASGAGLSIVGKITGRFLNVVGDIIAARILGPVLFGLYSIGWTLLRIVGLLAPLGFQQGVIKYIPNYFEKSTSLLKGLILSSIFISFLSGSVIGTGLYMAAPWMAEYLYRKPDLADIFRLFSFAFPVISLLSVSAAISRSTQRMKYTVIIEDIGQPLIGVTFVVLIYLVFGAQLQGVILSDILSYAITGLLGLVFVRRKFYSVLTSPAPPDYSTILEVMAFSLPTSLAGVFSVFIFWVDRLIIGLLLPAKDNGIYQAASQLSVVFVVLLAAFNAISTPMFADLFAKKEFVRLEEVYRVGTKWGFYLSIFPFTIFMLFPREILTVLYGADYSAGWAILMILGVGQIINSATGSIGGLLAMVGRQKAWMWLSALALMVNVILCFIFIPRMGISGAAIATSFTMGSMYLFAIYLGKYYLGVWPYDRRYIKGIVAGIFAALCGFGFRLLPLQSFVLLFGGSLIVLAVFFIGLYLFGFDAEDFLLISTIEARLGIRLVFLKKGARQ